MVRRVEGGMVGRVEKKGGREQGKIKSDKLLGN